MSLLLARKENKRKSRLLFSLVFAGFRKGPSAKESFISTERNGRLKSLKLLNLTRHNGDKSIQCHCFDIQGVAYFQTPSLFIDSPSRTRAEKVKFFQAIHFKEIGHRILLKPFFNDFEPRLSCDRAEIFSQ